MVRCLLSVLFGIVLLALSFPTPLRAQVQGSNGWYEHECQRESDETYGLWISRCNTLHGPESAERVREAARLRAEYQKLKATLLKQAPLPASRNRVIGGWQQAPRPRVPQDVISQIANIFEDGCELLFGGNGTVEFRADRWSTAAAAPPARGAAAAPAGRAVPAPAGRNAAPAPAGRASSAPPPAGAAAASRLFTLNDLVGYRCANGEQLVVNSCSSTSDESNCSVIRMDLPLRNGFQVRTNVTRGVLVKQVSACQVQKVMVDQDGNVVTAK